MQKSSSIYLLEFVFSVLLAISFSPTVQCHAAQQPPPSEVYATADDGTPLHWYVYTPTGNGPWPAVLVIHGGGFKGGTPISSPESVQCGNDLAAAGYIAFSIEYRLAPNGSLEGQVSDGRFPDQTNDVKLAILAARSDSRSNGQVGSVGGSAGGYHTAFAAGTGTIGQDRLDVGVSLSGAYDLSDFNPDWNLRTFTKDVTNYIGGDSSDTAALQAASPAYVMDSYVAPLFLINTEGDPMPFGQLGDMTRRLGRPGRDDLSGAHSLRFAAFLQLLAANKGSGTCLPCGRVCPPATHTHCYTEPDCESHSFRHPYSIASIQPHADAGERFHPHASGERNKRHDWRIYYYRSDA